MKFSAKRGVLSEVSEATENVDAEKIHGKEKASERTRKGVYKPRGYESVREGISGLSLTDQKILHAHSRQLMRKVSTPEALYVIQEDVASEVGFYAFNIMTYNGTVVNKVAIIRKVGGEDTALHHNGDKSGI